MRVDGALGGHRPSRLVSGVAAGLLLAVSSASGVTYQEDIRPIFDEHCLGCHNPDKAKGELELTDYGGVMKGSYVGPIIDKKNYKPESSILYLVVTRQQSPEMPPDEPKIPEEQIQLIRKWIEEGAPKTNKITYARDVRPIFKEHCFGCHNPDDKKKDLDLTTYQQTMAGSSSGSIVEAGRASQSKLFRVVAHQEKPYMPKGADKLPARQIEVIRQWIGKGALRNAQDEAKGLDKPDLELSVDKKVGRPEGEPTMPGDVLLQPRVHTERAGAATALAHSPWAPVVAVGAQKQILLYNSKTRELAGVLPFPEGFARSLRFSRSGRYLVAGGGYGASKGFAALFDVQSGERVLQVGDAYDTVLAADMNAPQSLIATGGPNKRVRAYSMETGKLVYEIEKHTEWVTALAYSPDGVLLASGDRNGGLYVWEAPSGREFYTLDGHNGRVTSVAWRPDSNALASAGDDGRIALWDMLEGKRLKQWGAHSDGVLDVSFTHDGRIVSTGRDKKVKVWSSSGEKKATLDMLDGVGLHSVFGHEGKKVIAGDLAGNVRVASVEDGKQIGELSTNPPKLETRIAKQKKRLEELTSNGAGDKAHERARTALQKAKKALVSGQKRQKKLPERIQQAKDAVKEAKQRVAEARKGKENAKERLAAAKGKAAEHATAAEKAAKALKQARKAHGEAEKKLEKKKKALAKAKGDQKKALKKEVEELKGKVAERAKAVEAADEKAKRLAKQARKSKGAKADAKKRFEKAASELSRAVKQKKSAEESLEKAQKRSKKLEKRVPQLKKRVEQAKKKVAEVEAIREKVAAAEKKLKGLKEAKREADLYEAKKTVEKKEKELEDLQRDLRLAEDALAKAEKKAKNDQKAADRVKKLEEQVRKTKAAIKKVRETLSSARKRIEGLSKKPATSE